MKLLQTCAAVMLFSGGAVAFAENAKITQIENALGLAVQLKGQPFKPYNILDRMKKHGVPGVSVAVLKESKISWTKAWGVKNVETREPVITDSLFQAASISKPVAAYGAMQMVDQDKINLHTPINSVLKRWQVPENDFTKQAPVTLARLLSHTAGMTVHGFGGYALDVPFPDILSVLNGVLPANSEPFVVDILPGSAFRYSGGGYTVAQMAMEDASGKEFVDLMDELVLKPSGMTESTYAQPLPKNRRAQAVTAYRAGLEPVEHQFHAYPELAAAGLWTTPTDLAKLALSVSSSWKGEDGALLTSDLAKEFLTEIKGDWGLGFRLVKKDDKVIGFTHGGANEGFRTNLIMLFDGRGFAVMTNSDTGGTILSEMMVAISTVYDWPVGQPKQRDWISLEEGTVFPGTYRITDKGIDYDFTVHHAGNGIVIAQPQHMPAATYYLEKQEDGKAHFFNESGRSVVFSEVETSTPVLHVFGAEAIKQ